MIKELLTKLSSTITEIASELPTNSALRERISFVNDQLNDLKERIKNLEKENTQIKKENTELHKKIKEQSIFFEEFVEHRGALFKRKLGSGYHLAVYCPICKIPAGSFRHNVPFVCAKCNWFSTFTGAELENIINELNT